MASVNATPSAAFTCPLYDRADLEAQEKAEEDAPVPVETLKLGEVFALDEARDPSGRAVELHDLGAVHLQHGTRSPGRVSGVGLGFVGMSPKWFSGKIAPPLEAALSAWSRRGEARMAAASLVNLLTTRANTLRAFPPAVNGEAVVTCAEADRTAASAAFDAEDLAWRGAADALAAQAAAHTPKNAHERLLAAYAGLDRLAYDDVDGRKAPLAELRALTTDPGLPAADRVWAWQGIAQATREVAAFEQAAQLSDDEGYRVGMLANALALAPEGEREKRLRELIAKVEKSGVDRWRLRGDYRDLAELRLLKDDAAGARDASVRCLQEVDAREPENIYRQLCSEHLAEAMFEIGAPDATVPAITLGPLAIAVMDRALARRDRASARRIGELLLERAPLAIEAPGVLERLRVIAEEPRRSALADRATRDYGTPSPWLEAQRRRLAPEASSPEELDRKLTALRPSDVKGSPPPTNADELEDELRARAFDAAQHCADDFRVAKLAKVTVTVDTTGPRPTIAVAPATKKPLTRCLERHAAQHFRSLGPRRIRFEVSEYPRPGRAR